jgi:hypothetical protein
MDHRKQIEKDCVGSGSRKVVYYYTMNSSTEFKNGLTVSLHGIGAAGMYYTGPVI